MRKLRLRVKNAAQDQASNKLQKRDWDPGIPIPKPNLFNLLLFLKTWLSSGFPSSFSLTSNQVWDWQFHCCISISFTLPNCPGCLYTYGPTETGLEVWRAGFLEFGEARLRLGCYFSFVLSWETCDRALRFTLVKTERKMNNLHLLYRENSFANNSNNRHFLL